MITPLLDPAGIDALRDSLTAAKFTSAGIADRIGPQATAAARRNDLRATLRATADGDPQATLIRLFICGQTEPAAAVAAALPLPALLAAGLLETDDQGVRAAVDLEPYGADWWVLADLEAGTRPGPLPADHVLGVGGASTTLAGATVRRPVGSALDLGTGCGVQALHLSTHADSVTATDLSGRALRFAATTAALGGQRWELLRGDLVAPVAGRRFDLVVSNPPFVVGPGTATHTYRDSGRAGDGVCAELAAAAPGLLNPGGVCQFLANWLHVRGTDWTERVAGWLAGTGLSAWVIQREVTDPVSYVNLWLADAAERRDPARAARWLDWFDAQQAEAVGFGIVTLRADGLDDPVLRLEDLRQPVEGPLGEQVAGWFDRRDWLAAHPDPQLLRRSLRLADGVSLHQEATMQEQDGGVRDWSVQRQLLRQATGLHRTEEVDPLVLALVAGCDGATPLSQVLALLAAAHDVGEDVLTEVALPLVTRLVEQGFVLPG